MLRVWEVGTNADTAKEHERCGGQVEKSVFGVYGWLLSLMHTTCGSASCPVMRCQAIGASPIA